MTEVCVDLNAVAEALRARKVFADLVRHIRRFHGKAVIKTDLDVSRRALDQLRALMAAHPDFNTLTPFEITAAEALSAHAVIAYCRALVSAGAGRFKTAVAFPAALRAAHERVASFRNKRLCHYGESQDPREASWANDRAAIVLDGKSIRLRFATSRRGWDVKLLGDLDHLTAFALTAVEEQTKAEGGKLLDELARFYDDPMFAEIVTACPFQPEKFFVGLNPTNPLASLELAAFDGVRFGVFVDE
jgi:hypothetical protein